MADSSPASSADVDAFIERWSASGASEIANANLFLSELCTLLGVDGPDPAGPDTRQNDYVFERRVTFRPDQDGERGRIDLYADFARQGKNYVPFPDKPSHRIFLDDLRDEGVRNTLRQVWTDPLALDPTRRATAVTRDLATNLAKVAASLERDGHAADQVAGFLMRCLFTMFAEDVGLLPERSFTGLLGRQLLQKKRMGVVLCGGGCSTLRLQKMYNT